MRHLPGLLQALSAVSLTAAVTVFVASGSTDARILGALAVAVALFGLSLLLGSRRVRSRIPFLRTTRMRLLHLRTDVAALRAEIRVNQPERHAELRPRVQAIDERYRQVLSTEVEHLWPAMSRRERKRIGWLEGASNERWADRAQALLTERIDEIDKLLADPSVS